MDLAPLVQSSARHRRKVLAAVTLVTLVLAAGLSRLRVETGLLDWLPRSHPNVDAFCELIETLPGAVNQELLWLELDDEKAKRAGVESITDHDALLAQEELVSYIERRVPSIRGQFGLLALLKAARAQLPGTSVEAKSLPRSSMATRVLLQGLRVFARDSVDALVAGDGRGTILSLLYDAPALSTDARTIGGEISAALEEYRRDTSREFDLFRDEFLVPSGLASGVVFIDETLLDGLLMWTPIAVLVLAALLRLVLGSFRAAVIIVALLTAGAVGTLGLMGWCGSTLNVVTIALVPLVLGCGVDYAILIAVESADLSASGLGREASLQWIGRSSAMAVALTAFTTASGLLLLVFSDAAGMIALGGYAAAGMIGLSIMAILLLPGSVLGPDRPRPSRLGEICVTIAGSLARQRRTVVLVFLVLSVGALAAVGQPLLLVDTIEGHYPPDSDIARATTRMREKCGGAFPEIVIVRGDVTADGAVARLRRVQKRLSEADAPLGDFTAIGALDILRLVGKGGPLAPRDALEKPGAARHAVDALHSDPTLASIAGMFVSKDARTSTILLLGSDPGNDPRVVRTLWSQLETALGDGNEGGLSFSFLGYRTMSYLFATYSLEWIRRIALVSLLLVLTLTVIVVRRARAVLLIGLLVTTSTALWYVLVHVADIYVSVFLLFPLIFVVCIGSDYGLHLLLRIRAEGGAKRSVWATTGRAISIAAFTDAVVFLLFTPVALVSVKQVMLAVALAVVAVFTATMLLVPAMTREP